MCVYKERDLVRDEKPARMALRVFMRFYELNTRGKAKTWDEFIHSRYYNDFLKVGRYITEINAINIPQFIDFLIRSALPVNKWTNPTIYETYVRELNKKETPEAAIERNILLMQQWANENGKHWTDFFREVSPAQATMWIKAGRISPWVLYITDSSTALFDRMSPEQLSMVRVYLDPGFWEIKLENHRKEADYFRDVLVEAGI